jgi:hypothetical protein
MSSPQSGIFAYTPDIQAYIYTQDGNNIDISPDIVNFTVSRQINAVSSFVCTLNNPQKKYNFDGPSAISTMDKITVFLKRINFVQVFTGYITYAPIETLIPQPVTIQASCTLRNLQQTYWDDTLLTYQTMLLNYMAGTATDSSASSIGDGGVAQVIVNLLVGVCGWNPNNIHIQGIPAGFVNYAAAVYTNLITSNKIDQNALKELSKMLSLYNITSGQSTLTGGDVFKSTETLNNNSAPLNGQGTAITVSQAQAFITTNNNGAPYPNVMNPVDASDIGNDIFWCSAPFSYLNYQVTNNLSASTKESYQAIIDQSKTWLAKSPEKDHPNSGRLLTLANQRTNRVVIVRTTSIPQKKDVAVHVAGAGNVTHTGVYDPTVDYLQLHPGVVAYLNGKTDDPTNWSTNQDPGISYISFAWTDETTYKKPGIQKQLVSNGTAGYSGNTVASASDPLITVELINDLINNLRGQIGDSYTESSSGRINPGAPGQGNGSFDCSGLAYWGYKSIGINLHGTNTWTECGPTNGDEPETYGQWVPNTQQPQAGDLIFWEVPEDKRTPPQHVSIMTENFDYTGTGKQIQASGPGIPLQEFTLVWNDIKNGKWVNPNESYKARYIGARRPITLAPSYTAKQLTKITNFSISQDNIVADGTSTGTNPTTDIGLNSQGLDPNYAQQRAITTLTNQYNNLLQPPQFDPRASIMAGTPRAFLLDNPVMQDLTQIINSGLRQYQSAPNGDFVAWFPDYYGVYGTDPVFDISPIEIQDFNIYHDDNQLTTHVGVIGDTTGVGAQVSTIDYITTNGIVSIQDGSTMSMLFGTLQFTPQVHSMGPQLTQSSLYNEQQLQNVTTNGAYDTQNTANILDFLNIYGMRPLVNEQQMIHSHSLEYMYALYTFMNQWGNQFVSTVTLTFMPEIYPGMRVSLSSPDVDGTTHQYMFYVNSVTHNGDRSAGFSTQLELTSPMKDGKIMHYGVTLVS